MLVGWLLAALSALVGLGWLVWARQHSPSLPVGQRVAVEQLHSGVIATLDSPVFVYSPGWRVDQTGADPHEPSDPWREPSGVITFAYSGSALDLLLAVGDYWGYLYVTVDDQPANVLPVIAGNRNSLGQLSGYTTLYAPEKQTSAGAAEVWVHVHRAGGQQMHQVRVEVWRGWGQRPLRAVGIDALPPLPYPRWPGICWLLIAGWCAGFACYQSPLAVRLRTFMAVLLPAPFKQRFSAHWLKKAAPLLALGGLLLIAAGVFLYQWPVTLLGLALLAWAALQRPALWLAALLFALPFYYAFPLPILPGRSLGLIDIGIWGGLLLFAIHWLLITDKNDISPSIPHSARRAQRAPAPWAPHLLLLFAIISWALVSAFNAEFLAVALREWRTVFLAAGGFALLLVWLRQCSENWLADQWLLLGAWLAGGVLVALIAVWQYASGAMVITAEGVWRVRAFYGSPNNLALYLDRSLAVTLALALFSKTRRARLLWGLSVIPQGVALLLTFSKGALLFGLPAMLVTLWWGGLTFANRRGQWRSALWWMVGAALLALLALTPFLGTERFQRLLDLRQGTGFVRLQLWQSAWQMALDHPWLGVGPDNFLYAFRSHYILPAAWQEPNLNHPHNWLLDWWTRLGLPGLVLALVFFGFALNGLWQGLRKSAQPALNVGLCAAIVAALAHGLIDASYALPDLMLVWVLLAFLAPNAPPEPELAQLRARFWPLLRRG